MSATQTYFDCWLRVATSLFSQALVGEPVLTESLPKPFAEGTFGFAATIEGDVSGKFAVLLDGGLAEATLLGEGADQKAGWAELLKEVADAAAGDLLARSGLKCRVTSFTEGSDESKLTGAFQLQAGTRSWAIQVKDSVRAPRAEPAARPATAPRPPAAPSAASSGAPSGPSFGASSAGATSGKPGGLSPGLELLLDVELEASLRFGAREMPLGEILDLGPGDVVQLDRHITDPVDLIVGDKIVARGEVVLVNGNFGLRVTEVAEPQRRLESIRCLF